MRISCNEIGTQIQKYRKAKGLSQEQLAGKVGVGITHISHIETGKTVPSISTLLDIINALEISAEELLSGSSAQYHYAFSDRITECFQDCSEEEIRILSDTMEVLKASLRNRDFPAVQKK